MHSGFTRQSGHRRYQGDGDEVFFAAASGWGESSPIIFFFFVFKLLCKHLHKIMEGM